MHKINFKKRHGGVLLLEAAIASIILALISYGVVQVNSAMFTGLSASENGYQAQFLAMGKANEINATAYTALTGLPRAAISGTSFEREVIVGAETDIGGGVLQKNVNVNVYTPGVATPTYSLLLQPTNKGTAANAVPMGTIVMWSGSSIPAGWQVCNGTNGTPDMRNRFPIGAGERMVGVSYGTSWVIPAQTVSTYGHQHTATTSMTDTNHNHYVDLSGSTLGHILTIPEMPSHNHAMPITNEGKFGGGWPTGGSQSRLSYNATEYAGGSGGVTQPHSHPLNGTVVSRRQDESPLNNGHAHAHNLTTTADYHNHTTSAHQFNPPLTAIYFIMKMS
ncbi:MAG: hypothetical protein WC725_04670 [Patescibacteria group bacterium]